MSIAAHRAGSREQADWPKLLAIGAICMAQSLPNVFAATLIPGILRSQGLALEDFWVFSLAMVPVWLKWLWAPLIDQHGSKRIGYRKSWIIPCTLAGALTYLAMTLFPPSAATLWPIVGLLVLKAFIMHTQDVAVDAYTLENLAPHERGLGAGVKVFFEACADFAGAAVIMALYQAYGWSAAAPFAAAFLVVFSLPVILRAEPAPAGAALARRREGRRPSVLDFLRRSSTRVIAPLLMLMGFFNYLLIVMAGALLVDLGMSFVEIGLLVGSVYAGGALAGSLAASLLLTRVNVDRLLAIVALALLPAYLPLARITWFGEANVLEAAIALALPAILISMTHLSVTVLRMGWAAPHQAATDFTLQGTAYNMGRTFASAAGGFIAASAGWFGFVAFAAGVGIAAAIALAQAARRMAGVPAIEEIVNAAP